MTETMTRPLIGHVIAKDIDWFTPEGALFDYTVAGNGVFVSGEREGLLVRFAIAECEIRGLDRVEPIFHLSCEQRVPVEIVAAMLQASCKAGLEHLEILFHLWWETGCWWMNIPPQDQSAGSCRPLESGPGSSHERALIEVHSHHGMRARFSSIDDKDEQGFRLYAVIGNLWRGPEIRLRVGLYGHWWEIPASWVFELPEGLADCVEEGRKHGTIE